MSDDTLLTLIMNTYYLLLILLIILLIGVASYANSSLVEQAQVLFQKVWQVFQKPWWIQIETDSPKCTYFFGPFKNLDEAQHSQTGYSEDLISEGANLISVTIDRFQPQQLTIEEPS